MTPIAHFLCFDASYAHVKLDFVQRLDDLKGRIEESTGEKWLVFCNNKESGRAFADSLNVSHQYLDADSKGSAEWAALLKNQRFECCVLVCTQAIDTGISIHDPKLKHVGVVTDDHTTFLQMIGRKRCAPGESYTVHVDSALEDDTFHILRDLVVKAASASGFYEDHPERLPEMGPEGVNHRLSHLSLPYCVKKCRKKLWLRDNTESPEEP